MIVFYIVLGIIVAYLIGSLPTAVWLGKAYYGIDVREHGSGNAGATNTFRVLGKKAGSIVMFVDTFKGWTATSIANFLLYSDLIHSDELIIFKLVFGVFSVIGHIFPVYIGFKGGKGVATLLGMVLAIHIEAALVCMVVFLIVLLASKYVSLGSMIAALAFPIVLLLPWFHPDSPILIIFGFAVFAIVVLTHQKNIKRIISGEENKTNLRIRRK